MLGARRDPERLADAGHPEARRAGANRKKTAELSGEDGGAEAMLVSHQCWDPGRGRHGSAGGTPGLQLSPRPGVRFPASSSCGRLGDAQCRHRHVLPLRRVPGAAAWPPPRREAGGSGARTAQRDGPTQGQAQAEHWAGVCGDVN